MMNECEFCKAYKERKRIDKKNNDYRKALDDPMKVKYAYTVAFVSRSWVVGRRQGFSRIVDYRYRGIGYKLNYCPECGRKLKGGKENGKT